MNKSLIIAVLVIISVSAWFLSGIFINNNDETIKSEYGSENSNKKTSSEIDEINLNEIIVETKISLASKIDQFISIQGQTKENRSIDLKSQTTGNIIKKNFERGQLINSDEVLIEISIEDRFELLNSFEKDLERINKELLINEEKRDNLMSKVSEQIKLFEIEYQSVKKLVDKGLSSQSKLNLASFNLAEANSNLKDIELNYQTQLTNLESQLANIRSKIKNIKLDIKNTKIVSPFMGIVESSNVELGTYVRPGDPIVKIVDLNPIKIQGYVSETDVNKIKLGSVAELRISNNLKKNGVITFISPVAETNTRTFELTIEADNEDLLFKSGLTTSIRIDVNAVEAHKISPSILTLKDDGSVGIKILDDKNKVVFFPVEKVKDTIDGMWVTGLPNNANIIVTGQEYVAVGQEIKLK